MHDYPEVPDTDKIPHELLAKALTEAANYPHQNKPYWIQVIGIPGSGKTTFVEMLSKRLEFRRPYTLASNDTFMDQIPEYQAMADRALAFQTFEGPARALVFELFKKLIAQKNDVLYEHSTSYPPVRDLMYYIKQSGFTFVLVRITVPLDVAKRRAHQREAETNRHIPESVIDERAALGDSRWEELSQIADYKISVENDGSLPPNETFSETITKITDFVKSLELN